MSRQRKVAKPKKTKCYFRKPYIIRRGKAAGTVVAAKAICRKV